MWWFILSILLGLFAVVDAKKRKNKMLLPILTFFLGPITFPVYLAKRNLKENEVREGGTGWNILKNFALYWTATCFVWGIYGMFAAASMQTANEYESAGIAIGAGLGIVMVGFIWFAVTVGALVIGLFMKKSSIVENGPTGELATGGIDTRS